MFVQRLKLFNYRNYQSLNIEFAKNFNVIYGENAQGKTNILESLFVCSSGRSHRTSKDHELIRIGERGYYVKVDFLKGNLDSTVEIVYEKNEKKKIKINDLPVRRLGDLMGNLNVVLFSPENLTIVKDGPSERRRFLDITISQLKPSYFYDLQQYIKILSQRNVLLKELQQKKNLMETLEVWNTNLVKVGSRIMKTRNDFIKRMSTLAEVNHFKLTREKERLTISYNPSIKSSDCSNLDEIEKAFMKELDRSLQREILSGTTLYGPQRDDYEILLNDIFLKNFGSQGQQRTAVLSIKLSEIDILREETGEFPILLLDDVMSELDKSRQEYLMDNLQDIQTFITTTDRSFFEHKKSIECKFIEISNGTVISLHNVNTK